MHVSLYYPRISWPFQIFHTKQGILKILNEINKKGATIIMATHNFDIVNSMKKRVITLEEGKLIKDINKVEFIYPSSRLRSISFFNKSSPLYIPAKIKYSCSSTNPTHTTRATSSQRSADIGCVVQTLFCAE